MELESLWLPRFWDTRKNEMLYPYYGDQTIEYPVKDDINHIVGMYLHSMYLLNYFIPMRPVGLKDTSGTLIYENDIIKCKNELYGDIYKVVWDQEWCEFKTKLLTNSNISKSWINVDRFTIIGNIYENSNLLEGKS